MALNTVSSDRLSTNVKNTNFTAAEKQDLTDDIKPLLGSSGGGRKNLVINGAMQVAQRGTSSTSGGYQTVDRMPVYHTGGAVTQSQESLTSGSPFENGFTKYLRLTNTTANTGTNVARSTIYKIESQDVANSGWDYKSSSSYITISFWVRSSVSQQFYIMARTQDGTSQAYPFSLGTLSANTWTKVTHSIPGNSNLQFDTDTNANAVDRGLEFFLYVSLGTDFTSSSVTLNAWGAYTSSARLPDYTNSWAAATNATFDITGYQIEVGSVATDFEHRSFAQELALCQRYYYLFCDGNNKEIGAAWYYTGSHLSFFFYFPTTMRAVPTGSATSGTNYYRVYRDGGNDGLDSISFETGSTQQYSAFNSTNVSGTAGQCGLLRTQNASAKIEFSAEL